ncbi:MAG: hypothetical protein ABJB11_24620 [Ferruginibacter sp.]
MKYRFIFFTAITFFAIKANAQTDKEIIATAIQKFKEGHKAEAYHLMSPLTHSKYFNADAEFCMGNFYEEGVGGYNSGWAQLHDDAALAMKWYKKAASDGNADAMAEVGMFYQSGRGETKKDEKEAFKWYKKSVEKGSSLGQEFMGDEYTFGSQVPHDYVEALKWYRLSAAQGNTLGMLSVADMYENGRGVPKDEKEALRLYTELANWKTDRDSYGVGRAAYILNEMGYSAGTGSLLNPAEEIKLGIDACSSTQYEKGFQLLSKNSGAAAMTDTAFGWLGYLYDHGYGVTEDATQAFNYIKKAAANGNAVAANNLAYFYFNGRGTGKDIAEALRCYQIAAKSGSPDAQVTLGKIYRNGEFVAKDDTMATEWFRKAALQAYGWGQYYLGLAYRDALGVAKDDAKAQKLFGYAADHGVQPAKALVYVNETAAPANSPYNNGGQPQNKNNNGGGRLVAPSYTEHACITCNGTGWVTATDRYGNTSRQQCSRCNGTGKMK